jgi:hypothetical protein
MTRISIQKRGAGMDSSDEKSRHFVLRKYIFLTGEGTTAAPNGEDVENFQVLGFSCGETSESAKQEFCKENDWIFLLGFSKEEIQALELTGRSE